MLPITLAPLDAVASHTVNLATPLEANEVLSGISLACFLGNERDRAHYTVLLIDLSSTPFDSRG